MGHTVPRQRAKISATLERGLVKRVREYQREAGLPSFSAALEELLWRQMMEERARAYYVSMSEEGRAEQEAWAKFSTDQFFKVLREE
jgi:hypothetical protein